MYEYITRTDLQSGLQAEFQLENPSGFETIQVTQFDSITGPTRSCRSLNTCCMVPHITVFTGVTPLSYVLTAEMRHRVYDMLQ